MPPMPPVAKDRTKTEHIAGVERIVYRNDDDTFCILALSDGLTALGPAPSQTFAAGVGVQYVFMGRWEADPQRGDRFRFSTYRIHQVIGRRGLVKYLTEICEGIGAKRAEKLWDKYGPDSLKTLKEEEPETVAESLGWPVDVVLDAAKSLRTAARDETTRVALYDLFSGRGFPGKLIQKCIAKWGAKAPAVIKRNPFALLGLPGAGFKRCDRLWFDQKLPTAALKRQAVALWDSLRTDRNGHTWVSAPDAAAGLVERVPGSNPVKAAKLAIRARRVMARKDADGKVWLADYKKATSELQVAQHLIRLAAGEVLWPANLPTSVRDGDGLPSEHQAEQWRKAVASAVGVLCGGPGTGKSHVVGYALRQIVEMLGRSSVAVCAPTGKAANRMTQAMSAAGLDLRATTIHTLLEIGRNGHDGEGWGFTRNAHNPLDASIVVVDETSMVDAGLMANLLDACATGTNVLFVGDPYQLPPVGHGAPLRDILAAKISTGELTQVRRNAGQIVHACQRIKAGEQFEFSHQVDLDAVPPRNLKVVECSADEEQIASSLEGLLSALRSGGKFDPAWQTQVIVARNKGTAVARKELNERLHKLLNPDGGSAKDCPWQLGDKVICLRNTMLDTVEPLPGLNEAGLQDAGAYHPASDEWGGKLQEYVANGEIGRVVAVGTGQAVVRFSERDELSLVKTKAKVDGDDDPESGGDDGDDRDAFDLAYAVTGHKMQGSQAPLIVIVMDERSLAVANREWLYTAVSRASKCCIILAARGVIQKSVDRVGLVKRKTFLAEQIEECRKAVAERENLSAGVDGFDRDADDGGEGEAEGDGFPQLED